LATITYHYQKSNSLEAMERGKTLEKDYLHLFLF